MFIIVFSPLFFLLFLLFFAVARIGVLPILFGMLVFMVLFTLVVYSPGDIWYALQHLPLWLLIATSCPFVLLFVAGACRTPLCSIALVAFFPACMVVLTVALLSGAFPVP